MIKGAKDCMDMPKSWTLWLWTIITKIVGIEISWNKLQLFFTLVNFHLIFLGVISNSFIGHLL